ncbi:PaaX family transcriptional regulator [Nesterenkonia alkaliphila]|nr:PaaX family transcriptional regulator C-terminal domain-containing protein [Nesterenkonia alkaliphila]
MPPNSRSLIMDLFGEYLRYANQGEIRLGSLLDLLESFEIERSSARVTLSRLRDEAWFTTYRTGRETVYRLSDRMQEVLDKGRERIFTRVDDEWDGWWTQLFYQIPEAKRNSRETLRKQLTWLGFGQFASSTWLSPRQEDKRIKQLQGDFPEASMAVLRSRTTELTSDEELVSRCWDLNKLTEDYQDFIKRYSAMEGGKLPEGQGALKTQIELLADTRRLTFRDPNLPIELQPKNWPGREAFELFRRLHFRLSMPATSYVESVIGAVVTDW